MTYQELKEQISQQGTQCGVNLGMSSVVLTIDTEGTNYDEGDYVATALAFAFGFSRDDVDESGVIYQDTFLELCKLLMELKIKNELPRIEFVSTDRDTFMNAWPLVGISYDVNSGGSLSWFYESDSATITQDDFPKRT